MLGICKPMIGDNELEMTKHGTALFPMGCYHDDLAKEGFPYHWHPELEAAIVTEGEALFKVNLQEYHLREGDAIFVNAGILHSVTAAGNGNCRLHSFCVHPRLIGGSQESVFWEKYLTPVLNNAAIPGLLLDHRNKEQASVIALLEETWQLVVNEPPAFEFTARDKLSQVLLYLWKQNENLPRAAAARELREAERMKHMLEYVHTHFEEDITMEKLAQSAGISKSEVLRCFHSMINTTPIQYVLTYRLRKAAVLLHETDWKIIDIALHCGFQEMSYFSRTFKKVYGKTPREYRKTQ